MVAETVTLPAKTIMPNGGVTYQASQPLPDHLQATQELIVHQDTHRCFHYANELFAVVGDRDVFVCSDKGLWYQLRDWDHKHLEALSRILDAVWKACHDECVKAEEVITLDVDYPNKPSHTRAVAQHIIHNQRFIKQRWAPSDMNDRSRRPVLPLIDGGAWDLTAVDLSDSGVGSRLGFHEIGGMKLLAGDAAIPEPDYDLLAVPYPETEPMERAIGQVWGKALMTRIAMMLLGPNEFVDVLRVDQSGWGKTTLIQALMDAFPGAVGAMPAVDAFRNEGKFSPLNVDLSEKLVVFVDEAGAENAELGKRHLHRLIDPYISVEKKRIQATTRRRTANAMLVGHDWPVLDTSEQGVERRIGYVEHNTSQQGMTRQHYLEIDSEREQCLAYLRAWLCREAQRLWNDQSGKTPHELTITPEARSAKARLISERSDPLVSALWTAFEVNPTGRTASADVSRVLKDAANAYGIKEPKGRGIATQVKKAYPLARAVRVTKERLWEGFTSK